MLIASCPLFYLLLPLNDRRKKCLGGQLYAQTKAGYQVFESIPPEVFLVCNLIRSRFFAKMSKQNIVIAILTY